MLNNYWFTEGGGIRPELLNEEAERIAASLIVPNQRRDGRPGKPSGVTSSQLRRLYGEVKELERRLQEGRDWDRILPLVKLMKAKVAYTVGRAIQKNRRDERGYEQLKKFLTDSIDHIEEKGDFLAFCKQFEAVVGFYYGITKGSL